MNCDNCASYWSCVKYHACRASEAPDTAPATLSAALADLKARFLKTREEHVSACRDLAKAKEKADCIGAAAARLQSALDELGKEVEM